MRRHLKVTRIQGRVVSRFVTQRQKPVKGGREALPSCVIKDILREVERRAARFHVSKSFVVAVALAKQFGIDEQESYETHPHLRAVK